MPDRTCSVEGCDSPVRSKGYCYAHYMRWYRKGTTDRTYPAGHLTTSSHGYLRAHAPGHPLADRRGSVYLHRKVLYDAIGPGPHRCAWCLTAVGWTRTDTAMRLEVDHLDTDKTNNALPNLIPSCGPCNRWRARYPDSFAEQVATHPQPIPPTRAA